MIRLAAGLIILICLAAAGYFFVATSGQPEMSDPEKVALGRSIYAANCASCHGENGEGQTGWETNSTPQNPLAPPHDETGHTWEHADRAIFRYIKTGLLDDICTFPAAAEGKGMPLFNKILSDQDIKAVIAYITSRWPEHVRDLHEAINREYNAQDDLLAEN